MTMNMYNKPKKPEKKYTTEDGDVYQIGWRYQLTVHKDGSVSYRDTKEIYKEPRAVLPNIEVEEGALKILLVDLVQLILERSPAPEIAKELWGESHEVRDAFMEAMVERYESGIGDSDRRKFLEAVKETVHSAAQDKLSGDMAKLEYYVSGRSFFYHSVHAINDRLRRDNVCYADGSLVQLPDRDSDPDFRVGEKYWNEAREFWRKEILKRFPKE